MISKKNYDVLKTIGVDCVDVLMNLFDAKNKKQLCDRCLPVLGILILSVIVSRKGIFDSVNNDI